MSTQEQIEANRRNGMLSKGPTTKEGKAVSAKNARKHGLLSGDVLLPSEDHGRFLELSERLKEELQPESELESVLVEQGRSNFTQQDALVTEHHAQGARPGLHCRQLRHRHGPLHLRARRASDVDAALRTADHVCDLQSLRSAL